MLDPDTAAATAATSTERRHEQWDAPWLPIVRALGFPGIAAYLTDRHVTRKHTIRSIAAETGFSRAAIESALRRHDVARQPHATSRANREERTTAIAARFGFARLDDYLSQPQTWVRRRAVSPDCACRRAGLA